MASKSAPKSGWMIQQNSECPKCGNHLAVADGWIRCSYVKCSMHDRPVLLEGNKEWLMAKETPVVKPKPMVKPKPVVDPEPKATRSAPLVAKAMKAVTVLVVVLEGGDYAALRDEFGMDTDEVAITPDDLGACITTMSEMLRGLCLKAVKAAAKVKAKDIVFRPDDSEKA